MACRSTLSQETFTDWHGVMADLFFENDSLESRLQPGVTSYHDNVPKPPPAMSTFKAPFGPAHPVSHAHKTAAHQTGPAPPARYAHKPVAPPRRPDRLDTRPASQLHSSFSSDKLDSRSSQLHTSFSSESASVASSDKSVTFNLSVQTRTLDDVSNAVHTALRAMTPEPYVSSDHSIVTSRSMTPSSDCQMTSFNRFPSGKCSTPNSFVTTATVHSASHSPNSTGYHDDADDDDDDYHHGYYTSSPVSRDAYLSTSPMGYLSSPEHREPTSDYSSGNLSNTSQPDIHQTQTARKSRTKPRKLSWMNVLPDNCIIKIFSYLDSMELFRCARISRRWYGLVWDASLWRTIRISNPDYDIDAGLKVLTTRLSYETPSVCMSVQNVVLNGCNQLTDRGLRYLAQRCPELVKLEIQRCASVTNWALFEVVSNCTNLQHLDTTGCAAVTCISLTPEAALRAGPLRNKQILLRHLDVTDCTNLEDSGLSIIASHCTQLVNLYLRRCVRITDIGLQHVASYCTSLRELSVCECRHLTDLSLRNLSRLDSSLRYLSLAKCGQISDVGIKYLARYCQKLRYLNVRGCEAVSDEGIIPLARNCKRLRSLDVGKSDITDDGIISLANHCTQLKRFSMKACEGVSDTGVTVLARKCPQLEQLNIKECHLTVEAYRAVKRHCKRCVIEHTNPGFY